MVRFQHKHRQFGQCHLLKYEHGKWAHPLPQPRNRLSAIRLEVPKAIHRPRRGFIQMGIRHQEAYIWVDGLVRGCSEDNTAWFACDVEANYQNAGGGTSTSTSAAEATILNNGYYKLSYTAPSGNGWITKLGYDTDHPFFNYPNVATGGSSTSYYCDQYYQSSGSRPVICCVGYSNSDCGWFSCSSSDYWHSSLAVRLCFRPVAGATGYTE